MRITRLATFAAIATVAALALTGCVAGEGTATKPTATATKSAALGEGGWSATALNID